MGLARFVVFDATAQAAVNIDRPGPECVVVNLFHLGIDSGSILLCGQQLRLRVRPIRSFTHSLIYS